MDTPGVCMWADVQLGPIYQNKRGKCCVVWDNCGPHKVPAVAEVLKSWNITAEALPPKMTGSLQVMDLVVNGPVKSGIRRIRVQSIFDYFQIFKIRRLQHDSSAGLPPAFAPPKPTQAEGITTVLRVLQDSLSTDSFRESMRRCFIHVGLWRDAEGNFDVYNRTKKGVLQQLIKPGHSSNETMTLGEVASEVVLTTRPARPDDLGEDSSAEEEESGSDGEE